jgi:hypothetical protein
MNQNEFVNSVRGHLDFLIYGVVAVIILVVGMAMIGDLEGIGISFTTLSPTHISPIGSVLTAIGGWLIFTFIVSFMIHRRGEKEAKYEIRATSLLLARFVKELDRAEIQTTQHFAELNKSMFLATTREILTAQGLEPEEVGDMTVRLTKVLNREINDFDSKASLVRSEAEARMKECCQFDMKDPGSREVPPDEILKMG